MTTSTPRFFPMQNVIQNFAWGSTTSMNSLFGIENSENQPQAELWMGAHPSGCSQISVNNQPILLSDFIAASPEAVLNQSTQAMFGELPFLFKVLAAENALSIQVHPSKEKAEAGFAREDKLGIAASAANRNYRDANHKPELVYALTEYDAMNGFRQFNEILTLFNEVAISELDELVETFAGNLNANGLEAFFSAILRLEGEVKQNAVAQLLEYAEQNQHKPLFAQILKLAEQYPGDIGLFSPLMLNLITLKPGEAMFLDACTPHAYIKGTALEIMANSDNVLRAGLTPKHIDVDELVDCTLFEPKAAETLLATPVAVEGGENYPVPVPDFKFSVYVPKEGVRVAAESAEILMPLDAPLTLVHDNGEMVTIEKGESVFIPFSSGSYTMKSDGRVARAFN